MKRLISLISTHGKSPGQAAAEAWAAWQKYQRVARESIQQLLSEGKITQEQAGLQLSQLPKEHPQPQSQPVEPQPQEAQSASTSVDNQIEELNKQAEREGMLIPKPPEGLQVILHQTSPKYPQKSVPVDQPVQPAVLPQPKPVPPVNTPEQSTKKYSRLVDTTSQHLGWVTQITNYPHPRKSQPTEKQIKHSSSSETPAKK